MDNDLISRSALLRKMTDRTFKSQLHEYQHYQNMVKNMPIAYDVDKVVERLKEKKENYRKDAYAQMHKYKNEDWAQYLDGMQCGIRDSIEIVKSGGIE